MGKAIYYKAISEGLFNININRSDKIDILIGLGGGTGSGIAFDLAKTLKAIQQHQILHYLEYCPQQVKVLMKKLIILQCLVNWNIHI